MGLLDMLFGKREINIIGNTNEDFSSNNDNLYENNYSFLFKVEDVFSISGRGTVVTGTILKGSIKIGDTIFLKRTNELGNVVGIEAFRKNLNEASAGDNVGILVSPFSKKQLMRGDVFYK